MPRRTERLRLSHGAPGVAREVLVHRYGKSGARPKAYLQASLHADEVPAMLVAHHLVRQLDEAAAAAAIAGEIVVVPYANPIGLAQRVDGVHLGRHELAGGGNFNRNWPDLYALVAERLDGRLTDSPAENVALIRRTLQETLAAREPRDELDSLRLILARLAVDADLVLDLHSDSEALMHLFLIPAHWPLGRDIAAELGCRAVLLAEDSGGGAFDEAFATPWVRLRARFPEHPIPPACLGATVELRGSADVSDELAEADARALVRALQRHGVISGDPGAPPELLCEATRLDACETLRAPATGIVTYAVELGAQVRKDDPVATLVDPAAESPERARLELRAGTDGLVLSRRNHKFVWSGTTVAKIVGREPLPGRIGGYLLED